LNSAAARDPAVYAAGPSQFIACQTTRHDSALSPEVNRSDTHNVQISKQPPMRYLPHFSSVNAP